MCVYIKIHTLSRSGRFFLADLTIVRWARVCKISFGSVANNHERRRKRTPEKEEEEGGVVVFLLSSGRGLKIIFRLRPVLSPVRTRVDDGPTVSLVAVYFNI